MQQDMTTGGVSKTLLRFTVPLILSGLLQQLYQIVDSLIVGNYVGETALAAVGVSSPLLSISIIVVTGLVSGATILLSQYYGARELKRVTALSRTTLRLMTALSAACALLGLALHRPLLALLHTPAELVSPASAYLAISFVGLPFLVAYNVYSAMLRGVGDSRTPLSAVAVSTGVNIALDLLFIGGLGMGVQGAAIATVLAQILSSLYLMVFIRLRHPLLRGKKGDPLDLPVFFEGVKLGLPKVIQAGVGSMGMLLLQSVMNSFGANVVTAITTAYKIDSLTILPIMNISVAISVFAGQNIGAGNLSRAKEGLKKGAVLSLITSVVITAFVVTCGAALMRAFGVSDAVAGLGQRFFRLAAIFYPILALQNAFSGFLQGNKDVIFTSSVGLAGLVLRVALSYLLAGPLGSDVIAIAETMTWVLGCALCALRYRSGRWLHTPAGISL